MIIVIYNENTKEFEVLPNRLNGNKYIWQYDYGQTLRIQGLHLPSMVEIHFSLQETGGTSVSRVGVTKDGVTDVIIPDSMLENDGATRNYDMFAFIYLTDATSGQTEYKIKLQVKSRPKPEVPGGGENPDIFHEAVQAVQKSADKASESEKQAEGWAHGREDLPERAQDNAKYYSDQTAADAKKTGTDRKEVERLVESVSGIDEQVVKVENLTKQAQTSATNAALSEQAAKTTETNAQNAQAGAETAEGNAELAERNAKASEQAVEKAKQLVTQMGQEVLDNKNHVDQTAQAFDLTAQQAVADVNSAGQAQTERVQSAGNTAVESIKTAQGTATQAVETAKTEAVKAVQTEGTTQTGNVTKEGEKQVQAVQAAAQEIVSDREQIAQNKTGIEALKQGKADAIVETASGEDIQIEDGSGLEFEGLRVFGKSMQDGVPSPESPVPIVNVGDKGTIEVGVAGKNLLNLQCYSATTMNNLEEEPVLTNDYGTEISTTEAVNKVVIKQKKIVNTESPVSYKNGFMIFAFRDDFVIGKLYNLSFDLEVLNNPLNVNEIMLLVNGAYVQRVNIQKRVKTQFQYQKQELRQFIELRCSGMNFVLSNIMITEADCDYKYEPYHDSQSLTLATPNGLPGIKVDKDGNYTDKDGQQWVCDVICEKDGVIGIERNVYPKHYTQNDYRYNSGETEFKLYTYNDNEKNIINEQAEAICDVFVFDRRMKDNYTFRAVMGGIRAIVNGATSLDDLKRLLPDGFDVLFVRNTPTFEPFPQDIQNAYKALHTNYPTTIISNDESAHMEVSYVADTKNYIASKIETPLQKQITDLQNALISQKISGGGIKVTDSARLPIKGFRIFGKSTQDGVPSPENPIPITNIGEKGNVAIDIMGKNLLLPPDINQKMNGVTYKSNADGSVTINGISTGYSQGISSNSIVLKKGSYILWGALKDADSYIQLRSKDGKTTYATTGLTNKTKFTIESDTEVVFRIAVDKENKKFINERIYAIVCYANQEASYEPYREPQLITVSVPNGLLGIKVKRDGNYTDSTGQQWISDEITMVERIQRIGRIASYNGEQIDTEYMSSYGELITGAEVIYVLKEPIVIPLTEEEISIFKEIHTNYPTTTVLNDENADMELTYTVDTQSYVDAQIAEVSKAII